VLPIRREGPPVPEPPVLPARHLTADGDLRRAVFGGIGLVLVVWFAIWFVGRTLDVLTLLSMAVILAVALRPTVDRLSDDRIPFIKRRGRRALAILTIYLALATVVAAIALIVIPQVVDEGQKLITNAPQYVEGLDGQLRGLPGGSLLPPLSSMTNQASGQLFANLPQAVSVLFFAISTVTGLLSLFIVLVLTFFLIMDADPTYKHFTSLLPPRDRGKARELTAKMGRKIEGWLKGIIVLSAFVGLGTGVGMWALGMPYPLLLGVTAGVAELVPLAGPYLASAPGLLLALFQPTWKLIAVALFFLALQMAENHILAPTVMGREVEIPPFLVILALLLGASLLGLVGAILALPVAAVVQVLWVDLIVPAIKRHYVERNGD
jgi:predicted PurR-regulated permease PerM